MRRLIDVDDFLFTLGISDNDIYCEETIKEYIMEMVQFLIIVTVVFILQQNQFILVLNVEDYILILIIMKIA